MGHDQQVPPRPAGYVQRWSDGDETRNRLIAPSGLNLLKRRVEAFQLDASIGLCKAPVSFGVVGVAADNPGLDLALKGRLVGEAPVETLARESGELGLGHIEPAAVLGRVMPFEALDEAPCLRGRERLVE